MIDVPLNDKIHGTDAMSWLRTKDPCTHKIYQIFKLKEDGSWQLIKQNTFSSGDMHYDDKLKFGGEYRRVMTYYASTWKVSAERPISVRDGLEEWKNPKVWTAHFEDIALAVEFKLACL